MSIKVEKTDKTNELKLTFTVEAEKFDEGMKTVYKKTAKYFSIPGFRKGKAPMSIIERTYGSSIFYEDTFNEIVPEIYEKELKENNNIKIKTISMDLSQEENCINLHKSVKDVDILINNAGFGDCGNFTHAELNKELSMIKTSIAGFMPGPLMATYYSTKAYVVRLSESIREELRKEKSKVQISILCPGPVNTNFNNVANVKFHMREANSYNVAKFAIDKLLKGKFYIIPGLDVKAGIFFSHFVPSSFVAKITYMVQKKKIRPKPLTNVKK